jgi:ketosteroid isomerase-like protein
MRQPPPASTIRLQREPVPRGNQEAVVVTEAVSRAETAIRQRVEQLVEAVRMKDVEGAMSVYAQDVVAFDIVPPLLTVGADAYRKRWQETFAGFAGPIDYEVRDLQITTTGDLAFLHSLNHIKGTLLSGQSTDVWLRWTACWRLVGGAWLIAHLHASVPADMAGGRAVLDLQPA